MKTRIRAKAGLIAGALILLAPAPMSGQESILLDAAPPPPQTSPAPATTPAPAPPAPNPAPQASAPSDAPVSTPPASKPSKKSKGKAKATSSVLSQVQFKETSSGETLLLVIRGDVGRYETKELQNPSRLVIDLFDVSANQKAKKGAESVAIGKVRVGVHPDMTRIVVDLAAEQMPAYQVQTQKKGLVVVFGAPSSAPQAQAVPASPAPVAKSPVPTPASPAPDMSVVVNPDEQIILKPVKKQNVSKTPEVLSEQLITIDLRDADIRNVLTFIASASGYNIVAGSGVSGRVTVRLKDVPWREALQAILQVKGLGYTESDGIIRVLPLDELQKEQSSRLLNTQLAEGNLPLVTRLLPVNYAAAQTLLPQVKEMLSVRGRVSVDERTNVLIVSDIQDHVDAIDRLIQTLDTQTPQVLIEARMVEANTTFSRSLGVQWGGSIFGGAGSDNPTGIATAGSSSTGVGGAVLAGKNYAVNLPATAATSGIGLALGTVGNLAVLNARLSAAESNGQAKTVSMPKIMTLDNKAAKITQGYQVPYTIYNLSTVQTQFVNAALQLDVIPHVTSDGAVQMSVKISQNAPDFEKRDNLGIPAILTKEATTELLVRDGDTAVIGGIYTRKAFNGSNQVPLLGSIPILGWLFKSTNKVDEQSEMLVFLTPRLMNRKKSTIDASLVDKKTGLVN